ncbi:TonB-dependent receptor [Niabella sp. CC-SYL272]|uniref:SusC/RagA family TonB-linked outer membrane protein n=1 Tax=Niabella agricola TaxID=2891571 RepID=UPI001F3129BF|nr:TonB-dependent receptor [Niabella agricola]MCF3111805.1 TonB-dependent receptor [Niabella agricola]
MMKMTFTYLGMPERLRSFVAIMGFLFLSLAGFSQGKITVVGTVVDTADLPLPNISITVQGNEKVGTATDVNGRFVLDVVPESTLVFTAVTHNNATYKVPAIPEQALRITLTAREAAADEEVIVTAYGKKVRRESVTGSVATIKPDQLRTPASNLTAALAGQVAGVIGFQSSGQPGFDNADFFVRGVTTFGYRQSPLILIDNIELTSDDLARLQVDDIAEFSILKDASATALYGSRGANGVILVTTKRGKVGKPNYNVRYDNSISTPTQTLKFADPITYMNLYNEAQLTRNPYQIPQFDADKIYFTQRTLDGAPDGNPYVYPAVDWMNLMFKKYSSTKKLNASISGGSESTQYMVSGSYSEDKGLLREGDQRIFDGGIKFRNYQLRSNVDVKLTRTTKLSVDLWGIFNDYSGPITNDASGFATDLYYWATHSSPVLFPAYFAPDSANRYTQHILFGNFNGNSPDRSGGNFLPTQGVGYANPYAQMMRGYRTRNNSRITATARLSQNLDMITKGLSFSGFFTTNRFAQVQYTMTYNPFYYTVNTYDRAANQYTLFWLNNRADLPFNGNAGSGSNGVATEYLAISAGDRGSSSFIQMQGILNYDRSFGDHSLNGSLVINRQQKLDPENATDYTKILPTRNLTYAGSARYGYQNKYNLQFDFGYNGSERFDPGHRFGFFPSVSGAWNISKENFWKNSKLADIVTMFKLRASYGKAGNDDIGSQRFFYLSNVNLENAGAGAVFGTNNGYSRPGVTIINYPNPEISWEISRISNYAVEFTLFNALDFIGEYWTRKTTDILQARLIPNSMGLEAGLSGNLGKASSQGLDLTLNYKKAFSNGLSLIVMSNSTFSKAKYDYYEEADYGAEYWRRKTGQYVGQRMGYIAERLFVDDQEAAASPRQIFGTSGRGAQGGDIKYRDINGDGVINNADMVPIGLPNSPQITYGFGTSLNYKHVDLNFRFTGQARATLYMYPNVISPFVSATGSAPTQILQAFAEDHWSEGNQNLYALYPRLGTTADQIANNTQVSTWWLRSGSLLRLKSAEIGYTLPQKLFKRLPLKNARIYLSGINLLRFSSFDLWEPELSFNTNTNNPNSAFNYPILKQYNLGINIQL